MTSIHLLMALSFPSLEVVQKHYEHHVYPFQYKYAITLARPSSTCPWKVIGWLPWGDDINPLCWWHYPCHPWRLCKITRVIIFIMRLAMTLGHHVIWLLFIIFLFFHLKSCPGGYFPGVFNYSSPYTKSSKPYTTMMAWHCITPYSRSCWPTVLITAAAPP